MFSDIRYWLAHQSVGTWLHREVEEHEESIHFAGPLQKWNCWVTFLLVIGFAILFFALDRGQLRNSLLMLMLIVSVTHLVLMAWVYPIVRRLYQQEYELWFKGHMQNFGWAALFAVVPLWHRW